MPICLLFPLARALVETRSMSFRGFYQNIIMPLLKTMALGPTTPRLIRASLQLPALARFQNTSCTPKFPSIPPSSALKNPRPRQQLRHHGVP